MSRARPARLHVEALETRCLPSLTTWPALLHPAAETGANDTLDRAQNLGDLSVTPRAEAVGTIGNAAAGAADVDWYRFQLDRAANVTLATPPLQGNSQAITTLSLYNADPNDFNDLYDPLGYRLLAQADSAVQMGGAHIAQRLASGSYYVAVSGSGNDYFHPFLVDSGTAGATGDYGLLITAADLGLDPADGPIVLGANPRPGASLDRSPFVIRVDLSAALDTGTIAAGSTVQLISNPRGTFGDGNDQQVALAGTYFSATANELQLLPAAPLAPGFYEVLLAGNALLHNAVLADANGTPLGRTAKQPAGADFSYTFHIISNEGDAAAGTIADDTPAGAHQVSDISNLGLLQIPGAIGDDSTDPIPFDPADVDLYHFHISDPGRHAFIAEVFAGRIGSPLDPALSLFQAGAGGQLQLIAANDNTLNDSPATNGTNPLSTDPVLYAGLMQGDYYLAVSAGDNMPDPVLGLLPGTNGIFDPNFSHSGQAGDSTGPYLLNLYVQPDDVPPNVVATMPLEGEVLSTSPTNLCVRFSKPMNLQQVAYADFQQTAQSGLAAVYILSADGMKYYPRLLSYDNTTQQAQFLMLDGLPNGEYQLILSGSGAFGLADLAGNPLSGNNGRGDYVVHFTVNGPQRGTNGNPLQWFDQEPNDNPTNPQDLGVLFPNELQAGVTITRSPGSTVSDTADYYRFQVLQSQDYILSLSGSGLPAGAQPALTDAAGNPLSTVPQGTGGGVRVSLDAGSYVVRVGGWTSAQAPAVSYQLRLSLGAALENPTPLTIGPAPAYRIGLAFNQPAAPAKATTAVQSVPTVATSPVSTLIAGSVSSITASPTRTAQQGPPAPAEQSPPSSPSSASGLPAELSAASSLAAPVALASPSASVPRLDISAPGDAIHSPGILLIANYRIAGEAPSFSAIPAEVLMSLSALPIGGVRAANRSALPSLNHIVPARSAAQPIRLTILHQPRIDAELDPEQQSALKTEQDPLLPQPASVPTSADDDSWQYSHLMKLMKGAGNNLQGVWRRLLDDLFMNDRWQGESSDWLQGLSPSALTGALQEDSAPDSSPQEQDGFEAALSNPFSDEPPRSGPEPLACASLLLGTAVITAIDVKRHVLVPARTRWNPPAPEKANEHEPRW